MTLRQGYKLYADEKAAATGVELTPLAEDDAPDDDDRDDGRPPCSVSF